MAHRVTHANNTLAHEHEGLCRFHGNRQTWLWSGDSCFDSGNENKGVLSSKGFSGCLMIRCKILNNFPTLHKSGNPIHKKIMKTTLIWRRSFFPLLMIWVKLGKWLTLQKDSRAPAKKEEVIPNGLKYFKKDPKTDNPDNLSVMAKKRRFKMFSLL